MMEATESQDDWLKEEMASPDYVRFTETKEIISTDLHEIYNFMGGREILEHTTRDGTKLALKVRPPWAYKRSDAEMMRYAATHGVLAPKVRGIYEVMNTEPIYIVVVSERVSGVSLDTVWQDMSETEQADIKRQLREQLAQMRKCTLPRIGRPDRGPMRNMFSRLELLYHEGWDTEEEFEEWLLKRVGYGIGASVMRWRCRKGIKEWRTRSKDQQKLTRFVLTHGDLSPRNIMVDGSKITGIVDWDNAGFYPEWAEYAFAMALGHEIERWWRPVLEEILEPCPEGLLKLTGYAENW